MTKRGFSLLELMVAIALIGIVAAIVAPNLRRRGPKEEREQFIENLNGLMKFAWQNGVTSGKTQKIEFDFSKARRKITISESTGKKNKEGEQEFKSVNSKYGSTTLKIPSHFVFKNFYIEGFDEITRHAAGKEVTAWFYIIPEGLSQSVIINFIDTKDKTAGGRPRPVGLVLNPFYVQFSVYGTFKKP